MNRDTTGDDLRIERILARLPNGKRISASQLARAWGYSRAWVSAIEAKPVVREETAERYRAALRSLTGQ
jgi:hypothetical protein